ncbi:hypothetical protein Y032_0691g1573 [Ancylostoma ceylanicum]|uniref:Uncharacterized protein n=1 Tax=Ancylostoma ceylanicum TaxID=53326 RepID=A0A016WG90_9BILA|nr:hypothetical protein Y032_0691g1573 [Ancylostoma ceylanicum]
MSVRETVASQFRSTLFAPPECIRGRAYGVAVSERIREIRVRDKSNAHCRVEKTRARTKISETLCTLLKKIRFRAAPIEIQHDNKSAHTIPAHYLIRQAKIYSTVLKL